MNAARAAFVALLLCFSLAAAAEVAVPPLSGRVVDQTGTLSSGEVAALTQTLQDLETRKGSQIAVLIVPTTDQETIEQFSIRVAEAWKIGRKKIDDGALLVVAKNDRRLRIEVGYGLEGALTDATARRIIDEDITPRFKSGDFAGGISAGVDRIIRVIDGEKLPAPEPEHWRGPGILKDIDPFNPFLIAAVFVIGGILRSTLGRLFGSVTTAGVVGLLAWFLVGSLALSAIFALIAFFLTMFGETIASSGGRRGGWSGGSGGSSSGGGFSGGGGSFGGGGASGRW
ncbi:MAG: YgcG family protein [Bradyrhizobium sp.]|nr:YgcG family protein [Bradyrhizobium sp.]